MARIGCQGMTRSISARNTSRRVCFLFPVQASPARVCCALIAVARQRVARLGSARTRSRRYDASPTPRIRCARRDDLGRQREPGCRSNASPDQGDRPVDRGCHFAPRPGAMGRVPRQRHEHRGQHGARCALRRSAHRACWMPSARGAACCTSTCSSRASQCVASLVARRS